MSDSHTVTPLGVLSAIDQSIILSIHPSTQPTLSALPTTDSTPEISK